MTAFEKITKIKNLFEQQRLEQNFGLDELLLLMNQVSEEFAFNFKSQDTYKSTLLAIYEQHYIESINLLLNLFFKHFGAISTLPITDRKKNPWDGELNSEKFWVVNELKIFMEKAGEKYGELKLSDKLDIDVDPIKAKDYCGYLNQAIQHYARNADYSEDIGRVVSDLCIYRNLSIIINHAEEYYFLISEFIQGLLNKQDYQLARDLGEQVLISAYEDHLNELGNFLLFKIYSKGTSPVKAMYYGVNCLVAVLKKSTINDFLYKEIIYELMKFCRDNKLSHIADKILASKPSNITYTTNDNDKLFIAYYGCYLNIHEKTVPEKTLTYLLENKKEIIDMGQQEVLPWLVMLLRITKEYNLADTIENDINILIEEFKNIVDINLWQRIHTAFFGTLEQVKFNLATILTQLSFTRTSTDFISDNGFGIAISHQVLLKSFQSQDVEGYLLAMILKSDFSIVFKNKSLATSQKYISKVRTGFIEHYITPEEIIKFLNKITNISIIWLGTDGYKVCAVFYNNSSFKFIDGTKWTTRVSEDFINDNMQLLPHISHRKINLNKVDKLYEDYLHEEEQLKKLLGFTDLSLEISNTLLVVKDILITSFPHNLLLNRNEFLIKSCPIANIMSIEWLIQHINHHIKSKPSIAIWIPTEGQIFVNEFIIIQNKLEKVISDFSVIEYNNIVPKDPLNSDINIIVAHGNEAINSYPSLYVNVNNNGILINNVNTILGKGGIAILFVCYAGSVKNDFLRNQVSSVVKHLLLSGYKAVVAPFWALSTDIPHIWLPKFLKSFLSGKDVAHSVWEANKEVFTEYNTPKAYACLHLYGNPFLKIQKA